MATVFEVPATRLIQELAKVLKEEKKVAVPAWGPFVKTGGDKEKRPEDRDWWFTRSASLLRKIYINGPMGIHELQKVYGGKKNRGHNPAGRRRGSGAVIRNALQQLEKSGLIRKTKEGRVISPTGVSLLEKVSGQIQKAS